MKRWAALTVLLYALVLLLLSAPMVFLGLARFGGEEHMGQLLREAFSVYAQWGYWIWLGVMVLIQAVLLLVPLGLMDRRLKARRRLRVSVITTALLLANMLFGAVVSVLCAVLRDNAGDPFTILGEKTFQAPIIRDLLRGAGVVGNDDIHTLFGLLGTLLALWLIWGFVFYRYARADDADSLVKRVTRWLLRGSILELLVAVPSHIVVRSRNDCCAPFGSFWGIATGLSIMLLSFGPGVFFLFVERCRRLQPRTVPLAPENPDAGTGT